MGSPEFTVLRNAARIKTGKRGALLLLALENAFKENTPSLAVARISAKLTQELGGGKTIVLGFGKASLRMFMGIRDSMGSRIYRSTLIVPEDQDTARLRDYAEILTAPHPFPDQRTVDASRRLLSTASDLNPEDNVIVLISGGASSMFEIPAEGISIETEAELTRCLMNSGADIFQLNTIRQAMSSVKGGKLARLLHPARVFAILVSDVPGDSPEFIGSGPLTPVNIPETAIINIENSIPSCRGLMERIKPHFMLESTPKEFFRNVTTEVVLRNSDMVSAITSILNETGEPVINLGSGHVGEVQSFAERLYSALEGIYSLRGTGFWFVAGGETTSKVVGTGYGGRNQELVMRLSLLARARGRDMTFLSAGTDGIDGNSECMGGVMDSKSMAGIDEDQARHSLESSDSSTFLMKHGLAICSGPTGNNVSDIFMGYFGGMLVI